MRLRERLSPGFEDDLSSYFDRLGARVERRATEQGNKELSVAEIASIAALAALDAARLITATDVAELIAILGKHYGHTLELLWPDINLAVGVHSPYSIFDPIVQQFLDTAGSRVTAIDSATRQTLRDTISKAQRGGYGVDDFIRGVKNATGDGYILPPIRDVVGGAGLYPGLYDQGYAAAHKKALRRGESPAQADALARAAGTKKASDYRALNIARTELGHAANAGSIESYRRTGLVLAVRVYDGDDCGWTSHDDPDKAHNSVRTLDDARDHLLAHPSCQRAFAPITDPAELPQGWGELTG